MKRLNGKGCRHGDRLQRNGIPEGSVEASDKAKERFAEKEKAKEAKIPEDTKYFAGKERQAVLSLYASGWKLPGTRIHRGAPRDIRG